MDSIALKQAAAKREARLDELRRSSSGTATDGPR